MLSKWSRGSEWRKWDLHIHTPASHLNNNFGNDWDNYVQTLFNTLILKDIHAIALTDYFTIEGYKIVKQKYLDDAKKLRSFFSADEIKQIHSILVLPNIEFRLNKFVGDKSINFHVIFSNEVPVKDIEEHFLHDLYFVYEGDPQSPDYKRKLKLSNLEDFGKRLKEEHSEFRDKSDIFVGMMNAVVDDSDISEILSKDKARFENKYLLGVTADEDLSDIDWNSRAHNTRKVLIQKSDFLFSSNPKTRMWALGKPPYKEGRDLFITEFHSLKPCIHGSDAHGPSEIGYPCSKRGDSSHDCTHDPGSCTLRFHWVKADTTFEGFKQIIYEPELRSIVKEENPSESETYSKISSFKTRLPMTMQIYSDSVLKTDFCIRGSYELEFSNNLTCIIGGRGSGKSAFVHLLFNSQIDPDHNRLTDIDSPLTHLDYSQNPLSMLSDVTEADIPPRTEFFFQNEIEQSAKDLNSMSKIIIERLYKLSSLNSGISLKSIEDTWNTHLLNVKNLIENYGQYTLLNKDIIRIQREISTLKTQTEVISSDEYKQYQSSIQKLSEEGIKFYSFEGENIALQEKLGDILTYIEDLDWMDEKSKWILDTIKSNIIGYIRELKKNLSQIKTEFDKNDYDYQIFEKKNELRKYLNTKGLSSENIEEITDASQEINRLDQELVNIKKIQTPHSLVYDKRNGYLDAYKETHRKYKERLKEVCKLLQEKLEPWTLLNMAVTFEIVIDENGVKDKIIEYLKENIKDGESIRSDFLENIMFRDIKFDELVKDKAIIRKQVNNYAGRSVNSEKVQELINDDEFLEKTYLRLYKEYHSIQHIKIQTKLGNKPLSRTSFGERCSIVITLILVAGTNPIIIDQPEDHLDGRFIAEILVPLIRIQKYNRQIITVSRDANIVIGGDSELIHILEIDNSRTKIQSSTIENIESREKYIWLLDGGEKAFRAREQKYCLPSTRFQPIA